MRPHEGSTDAAAELRPHGSPELSCAVPRREENEVACTEASRPARRSARSHNGLSGSAIMSSRPLPVPGLLHLSLLSSILRAIDAYCLAQ